MGEEGRTAPQSWAFPKEDLRPHPTELPTPAEALQTKEKVLLEGRRRTTSGVACPPHSSRIYAVLCLIARYGVPAKAPAGIQTDLHSLDFVI